MSQPRYEVSKKNRCKFINKPEMYVMPFIIGSKR